MVWRDPDEEYLEEINATWEELSQFSKENFRFLTFSEHDRNEKTSVFHYEQNVPTYEAYGRDYNPVNFLSILFIESHRGTVEDAERGFALYFSTNLMTSIKRDI